MTKKNIFSLNVTREQAKDTGMAMVLIGMLAGLFTHDQRYFFLATLLLIGNMVFPVIIYKPVAIIWLGLSRLLGRGVSNIVLSIFFFFLVTPIGIVRRLLRKDSMRMTMWKKGMSSSFNTRDHTFRPEDIEYPY